MTGWPYGLVSLIPGGLFPERSAQGWGWDHIQDHFGYLEGNLTKVRSIGHVSKLMADLGV